MAPDEALDIEQRDDGTWDLVQRGEPDQVLSNHPRRASAEAERFRLAEARSAPPGDDDIGRGSAYPTTSDG